MKTVKANTMSEEDFEDLLMQIIENHDGDEKIRVRTFENAGILTDNRGLVVRIGKAEFQVTIVQSC